MCEWKHKTNLPELRLEEVAHVVGVRVEVGVGRPGVCVHLLQAGGDALLRIAGETLLTRLDQLAVGELEGQSEQTQDY